MSRPTLDFWFELASTYSYLSAERIDQLAEKYGVIVTWRPFLLGPIFHAQGWDTSPFNLQPAKGQYMWRDLERLSEDRGLPPFRRPDIFPMHSVKAARLALVGLAQGWGQEFVRNVYRAGFQNNQDISDNAVLMACVVAAGGDPISAGELANSDAVKQKLRGQTEMAVDRGLFGAPAFTVDDQLFWGDDRLEQAMEWAVRLA